jgi:hypothetical protein
MEVIMTEMQSLRQRSAKARRKAIFAGILYLIGTVGMAVAAFLPLTVGVEVGSYGAFGIANFWQPIADAVTNFNDLIATPANYILALTASLLYALMVLFTVINALRAISKLDHLCMKGSKRIGFNQNKIAVDAMGKIFACSFSLVVAHTVLIMALFPAEGATFSLTGIIVGGAGLFIHFVATPVAASISKFTVRDTIAELPRKHGMFSPILRNFFQFAAIGGIAFFLMNHQRDALASILTTWANPIEGWNNLVASLSGETLVDGLFALLDSIFWLVGLICFLVIFRHAVNPTEYYACGNKARGRKVVRVFSFIYFWFLLFTVLSPIIHAWIAGGFPANIGELFLQNLSVVYAMAVALGLFIIEKIMKKYPKVKKAYRQKPEEKPEQEEAKEDEKAKEAGKDEGDDDKEIQQPLIDDVPEEKTEKPSEEEQKEEPATKEEPKQKKEKPAEEKKEPAPAPAPAAPKPLSPRAKQARAVKEKWIKKGMEAREKAQESK